MGFWSGVLGGVAASLVASAVWLLILTRLRPRIKISKYIARRKTGADSDEYLIKFVNMGRRACVDVRVEAYIVEEQQLPSNDSGADFAPSRNMRALDLTKRGPYVHGRRKREKRAPHAQRVRIKSEHITEWRHSDQKKHILLRILAKDGLTGFPAVFEQQYMLSTCVREGTFITGDSLEVTKWVEEPDDGQSPLSTPA